MDWIELTIHTTTAGADIVSEALMAEGATGTMVEDRADIPDPNKPNGYWEIIDPNLISSMPEDVLVHAWFTPDSSFADRMQALRSRCDELHHMDLGLDLGTLEISTLNVHDEDWAEVWKKFYKPFKAGRSLVVKPTWEHYDPQPGDRIIEIDPGMAFGSGTHETTSMCVELLQKYLKEGDTVLDVGCGSGILGISAAKLGAKRCYLSDLDPIAVESAEHNCALNNVEDITRVTLSDLLTDSSVEADVILANITAEILCLLAPSVPSHLKAGGTLILSGIIESRLSLVKEKYLSLGLTCKEERRKGEWFALVFSREA